MSENTKKKIIHPILWIIFAVIFPLIIVAIIVIAAFNFAGFDVENWAREKANELPVIANYVDSPEEKEAAEEQVVLEEKLAEKNETIDQMETYIEELERTLDDFEQEISRQAQLITRYETDEVIIEEVEDDALDLAIKEMANTFKEMKTAGAAQILSNMDEEQVVIILQELPNDTRGNILEAMEIELAATLASRMLNE